MHKTAQQLDAAEPYWHTRFKFLKHNKVVSENSIHFEDFAILLAGEAIFLRVTVDGNGFNYASKKRAPCRSVALAN